MSGCPFHNNGANGQAAAMPPIMEMLKTATSDLHSAAEGHAFQSSLVKGELPPEAFARYMGQLYLVHTALERALDGAAAREPVVSTLFKDAQRHSRRLAEDLRHYGLDPAAQRPTPGTQAVLAKISEAAANDPSALLGHFYVLEGSMNGNSFIAKAVCRAYGIAPGTPGVRYLDPYGANQRPQWQAFKDAMNAANFDHRKARSIVTAAQEMFRGISGISADMVEHAAA